ncbi:MAG: GLPGLI family protein [Fulvivirga sp.]
MKIAITLLATCLTVSVMLAQPGSQALKCTYQLTFQPDSTDKNNQQNELMLLYISKNESQFVSKNFMLRDSLKKVVKRNYDPSSGHLDLSQVSIPQTRFRFIIYKSQEIIDVFYDKLGWFKYSEDPEELCWEISNEIKSINGLSCQKAMVSHGGRNYVAWFTNEIPVPDGPYIFSGLPGLIVEITDTQNHYNFSLIQVQNHNGIFPFEEPKDYLTISKAKFLSFMADYRKNPIKHLKQYASVSLSPAERKRIKDRESRRNNPIELKAN